MDIKDKWALERWGKFTASEIYKLLGKGRGKDEMFGAEALGYIRKKAIEQETIMWEAPELEFAKPILWGRRYEQPAHEAYIKYTRNTSMKYFGTENPLYLEYSEDSGGSPDGLMGEGAYIYLGLEIKCPKQSAVHWEYRAVKDAYGLPIEYFAQIQFLLMITQAPEWHFCSFDERFKDPKKRIKLIEVKPDKKFQENLRIRILQAIKERDRMIEIDNNN